MPLKRGKKHQRKRKMESDPKVQNEINTRTPNEAVTVIQASKNFPLKFVFIGIGVIVYTLLIFYLAAKFQPFSAKELKQPEVAITQEESPISIDLLRNPVVYQWSGSVEGTLTAKTEDSITLNNKDASLTIPVTTHRKRNIFFYRYKEGTSSALTIDRLELGTFMVGQFWVLPSNEENDKIDGISFSIKER